MALGRGLSELLGEVESAYENSTDSTVKNSLEIDVNRIKPNPNQPRRIFDENKLQELADSIKNHGLLQPISVISDNDEYILVAGERRLRAHKLAGLDRIKVNILDVEDQKLRELALIENIQRDDLNIIELAYSYAQLINEHNLTHDELSSRVSKSRSSITNTLRLLTLGVYAQQMLGNYKISAGHAKVLIGLNENEQKIVIDSIIGQKLSVRETENLVRELKSSGKKPAKATSKKVFDYDFKSLNSVVKLLESDNLKVKAEKNYFKIEIKSQKDIEKISRYFTNL